MSNSGESVNEVPGVGGDAEDSERAWYEQPAAYVAAALLGVGAIVGIIALTASGGGDTTPATSTTSIPADEADCRAGESDACEELDGGTLGVLCDDEVDEACAEIFRRLGDESQSSSTTDGSNSGSSSSGSASESDTDRCRSGDASACSQLSNSQIDSLCGDGADAACAEADARFEQSPFARCERDESEGCADLDDGGIIALCPDASAAPGSASCQERTSRGI